VNKISATYNETGDYIEVITDAPSGPNKKFHIPNDDMSNRHRITLQQWVSQGNTISPYVAPASPTVEEQAVYDAAAIDRLMADPSTMRAMGKALMLMYNEIRVLKGQAEWSPAQFKSWLKDQIRG